MIHDGLAREILDKALRGNNIEFEEAKILMDSNITPLDELIKVSNEITRRNFGNEIDMCAIYPAKIGLCSGDCAFCAQSVHNKCDIKVINTSELSNSDIVENAKELYRLGVKHYSLVTSGEYLTEIEFDKIVAIFKSIKKQAKIGLCASLGTLTSERAERLREAGVSRYHHNIETSRSNFAKICTTHSYDDKIKTINVAQQAGLEVCCGGIISMGETAEQRVEMAFAIRKMNVTCVPINILNPIPGTRLENQALLNNDDILRTIAVFRAVLQDKSLRFAGGRDKAMGKDEYLGYNAGMNAMIVGNYLTTEGKSFEEEMCNLRKAGYTI